MAVDQKSEARGPRLAEGELSLGKVLTASRQAGGFTPEQVAAGTHIPAQYIKALENDDYGLISDQLYMLPFLRRYAAFVGLDPEDVASRFVREVQRAETGAAKVGEPIEMISGDRRRKASVGVGRYLLAMLAIVAIAAAVTFVIEQREDLIRHFIRRARPAASQSPQSPVSQASAQAADGSSEPLKSSVTPADSGDTTSPKSENQN